MSIGRQSLLPSYSSATLLRLQIASFILTMSLIVLDAMTDVMLLSPSRECQLSRCRSHNGASTLTTFGNHEMVVVNLRRWTVSFGHKRRYYYVS